MAKSPADKKSGTAKVLIGKRGKAKAAEAKAKEKYAAKSAAAKTARGRLAAPAQASETDAARSAAAEAEREPAAAAPRKRREPPATATVPESIARPALRDYLAVMSQAVFQAGLSWAIIESKWPAYLELFENFEPRVVASFGAGDVERLMLDGRIVRTQKKIFATIENAKTLLALDAREGGFRAYVDSFSDFASLEAALRKQFKFLGQLSTYYLLFRTNHAVPRFEDWERTIEGDHPRMRAMVALGRANGTSSEVV